MGMYRKTDNDYLNGTSRKVVVMEEWQALVLRKLLLTKVKTVANTLERLTGLHEAGEATERNLNELQEARDTQEVLDDFLRITEI